MADRKSLNKMGGQGLSLVILALPSFHRVLQKDAQVSYFALILCANLDLFCHD
jgi:hypothetical protein